MVGTNYVEFLVTDASYATNELDLTDWANMDRLQWYVKLAWTVDASHPDADVLDDDEYVTFSNVKISRLAAALTTITKTFPGGRMV